MQGNDKYIGIYSQKATEALRGVFGDVVDKVFLGDREEYFLLDSKERYREDSKANWTSEEFDWSITDLIVQFTNGKQVFMTNSEWASFHQIHNFKEYEECENAPCDESC